MKAVLLCLRYADNMAFGARFVLLGVQKEKSRFKNKSFVVCVPWRHIASIADVMWSISSRL